MSDKALVFVGTLNRATPYFEDANGEGLLIYLLDEETGQLTLQGKVKGIDNPTYLSLHPEKACLYATSEVFGWNEGTVSAYSFDRFTGALTYLNKQPALGSLTAYSTVDRSGRYLLLANYAHEPWNDDSLSVENPGQAAVVYPIAEDGSVIAPISWVKHHGTGPDPDRQERPHPHSVVPSLDNRFAVVPDLGIDQVICYRFEDGQLTPPEGHSSIKLPGRSGPRHFVFSTDNKTAYVINELGSTIGHLSFDAASGAFEVVEIVSTIPAGFTAENRCADLHMSSDERFLYGSNRGHDSIAIFAVDPKNRRLTLLGFAPTEGRTPRNFALSPSEKIVLAANQNGDSITVFRRDPATGLLDRLRNLEVGTPVCIKMVSLP